MKILITGGAGFIGSHLGLYLMKKNHQVLLLDNLSFGYRENLESYKLKKINFIKMDIRDSKVGRTMIGVDVVFHFAGISSLPECQIDPKEAYDVNVVGTANVIDCARKNNVKKIIFSSTSAIYENEKKFPTAEIVDAKPNLVYALTKKSAEEICESFIKLYGMDITILRFFNTYGPHMDFKRPNPPVVSYIIKCLLENKAPILHSNGRQSRDMMYVDDITNLCDILIRNKKIKNGIFNVGTGKSYTINDLYNSIASNFKKTKNKPIYKKALLLWDSYPQLFKTNYPFNKIYLEKEVNKYTLASIKNTKKITGWKPKIDLNNGIKKTVEFIKKNHR